jgi:cytochrome P450
MDTDYRNQPDNRDTGHIPGDDGYPLVGKALTLIDDVLAMARDHHQRYGNISRMSLGPQKGLLVLGADNYQRVFLDRDKNFSAEMGYASQLGRFYTGGLLLRDYDEHRFQRRMMQGAFKNAAMRNYVDVMNPILLDNMQRWPKGKETEFFPLIKESLLEVGARIFIGVKEYGEQAEALSEAFINVNEGLGAVLRWNIPGMKFHKGLKGKLKLHQYFAEQIPLRRAEDNDDMLSFMCKETDEEGNHYSDIDIIQNAAFLLFAAHDTTTSVLCHLMMYLGQNPEWTERLRQESLALGKDSLEYEDLDKLESLDRCFHEVLRLHPSVPLATRRTIRDCEMEGHYIPANTMLYMPPAFNQRDGQYWSNPDQFDPDRFSPEREEHKRHSFCYHPFGGGAHKCIGLHFAAMLVKCFMHQFLLRYDFKTPPNYQPKMQWVPLPKPADGVPLTITERASASH